MATVLVCALGALVLWLIFGNGDKPTELDARIWVADPAERMRRLADAIAAWRAGRTYISPEELERSAYRGSAVGPVVIANPNAEARHRSLVRCCPMHPPHWE
jgi:hypothetical protein